MGAAYNLGTERVMSMVDRRSQQRVTGTVHAFVFDSTDSFEIKCAIRDLSLNGCRIIISNTDDLPNLLLLTPEGFNKPISAMLTWQSGKSAGLCFEHAASEEDLKRFELLRARPRHHDAITKHQIGERARQPLSYIARFRRWRSANSKRPTCSAVHL